MNHSPSEMEALESSIEVVPSDGEFEKVLIDTLEKGHTQMRGQVESRRRITILNQGADYTVVFDKAQNVISEMRGSYEEMFDNWKLESEMNSRLMKEVDNLNVTIEGQKRVAKKVLDDKSRLQEQSDQTDRRMQSRVDDLESDLTSLKIELEQMKTDKARQSTLLEEKTQTLEFYRQEFGVQKEETVAFRPRVVPVRRTLSTPSNQRISKNVDINPNNRKVTRNADERKLSTGPLKLLSILSAKL